MPSAESDGARIYEFWDKYVRERDLDALMALYADDATIQSPLVPTFFGPEKGILRGKTEVQLLLAEALKRRPDDDVHFYRDGFQWNGRTLFWEYPAETPNGHYQVDLAEAMDIEGLVRRREDQEICPREGAGEPGHLQPVTRSPVSRPDIGPDAQIEPGLSARVQASSVPNRVFGAPCAC